MGPSPHRSPLDMTFGAPEHLGSVPDFKAALSKLEAVLRAPPSTRPSLDTARIYFPRCRTGASAALLRRAGDAAVELARAGGGGARWVERALLEQLASERSTALLPTWAALIRVERPRDQARPERLHAAFRAMIDVAALGGAAPEFVLRAMMDGVRSGDAKVARAAMSALADAMGYDGPNEGTTGPLLDVAQEALDSADGLARAYAAVMLGGVGRFQPQPARWLVTANLRGGKAGLTLSVSSEISWITLAREIVWAFNWDFDHCWLFGVPTSKTKAVQFVQGTPLEISGGSESTPHLFPEHLGDIHPRAGDKLFMEYDFGDQHAFDLRLKPDRASTQGPPEVVSRRGTPPPQYPHWGG